MPALSTAFLKPCTLQQRTQCFKPSNIRQSSRRPAFTTTTTVAVKAQQTTLPDDPNRRLDIDGSRPTSPKAWEVMSTKLRESKIRFMAPGAVSRQQNLVVVDIRPQGEYAQGRVPGAINVEFFKLIDGWDIRRIARRATFAFFGILNGTEYNTSFLEQFQAVVPDKNANILLYCNIGGSLEPYGPSEFGQQTRSLTAAYELVNAGYKNLAVLSGGYYEFFKDEREVEYDP